MDRQQAEQLLKTALGDASVSFRLGQWEAIDALVNQRRKLLVVQRTGWGKSSVYFISTRILRDRGFGVTIIISPLLALMRNQIESARRLGIRAATINSTNAHEEDVVKRALFAGQVDCLLISPERLANDNFVRTVLMPIADRIGLLVVDEAHCISDWGHDFRPDYRRIVGILRQLPPRVPVLGTTATANDRVIDDVRTQLGDILIHRGPLGRESLALQAMTLPDQASRLAWLAQVIPTSTASPTGGMVVHDFLTQQQDPD
jgi:ATP-dependent DNA helicase RecQ